jgi:hypothetical protein
VKIRNVDTQFCMFGSIFCISQKSWCLRNINLDQRANVITMKLIIPTSYIFIVFAAAMVNGQRNGMKLYDKPHCCCCCTMPLLLMIFCADTSGVFLLINTEPNHLCCYSQPVPPKENVENALFAIATRTRNARQVFCVLMLTKPS